MGNSRPTVMFGLGVENGMCLDKLRYFLLMSTYPLESPWPYLYRCRGGRIVNTNYHTGGLIDGGSGGWNFPVSIGPWVGVNPLAVPVPLRTAWTIFPVRKIAAIDEDNCGCAPASAARSIDYMMGGNSKALGGPQDIYDGLYEDMKTNQGIRGTTVTNFLSGKREYTRDNTLLIDSNHDFWDGDCSGVMDVLDEGGDVEIMIAWSGKGGHAAMVTSIIAWSDGTFTITYVDDPEQGNGRAENEPHTITVDSAGKFDGGSVIGFMTEEWIF
jgi:hypothetical protein